MDSEPGGRSLSMEQMLALRAPSQAVAQWLQSELVDRVETLRPLLQPWRILGRHLKTASAEDVRGADKAFESLQDAYRGVSGEPYRLPGRLESPIASLPPDPTIQPWEYSHGILDGTETRHLTVRSPASWFFCYAAPLSLSQARQMLSGGTPRNEAQLKQFLISALLMRLTLERNPGLQRLLAAMRLKVEQITSPETGKLPLTRLRFPIPMFRPADDLILNATRLSGVPSFEELVDVEHLREIQDPLRARLIELTGVPAS